MDSHSVLLPYQSQHPPQLGGGVSPVVHPVSHQVDSHVVVELPFHHDHDPEVHEVDDVPLVPEVQLFPLVPEVPLVHEVPDDPEVEDVQLVPDVPLLPDDHQDVLEFHVVQVLQDVPHVVGVHIPGVPPHVVDPPPLFHHVVLVLHVVQGFGCGFGSGSNDQVHAGFHVCLASALHRSIRPAPWALEVFTLTAVSWRRDTA